MKIRNSLKSAKLRDKNCRVVRRHGRVYVINKKNPRMKARQGCRPRPFCAEHAPGLCPGVFCVLPMLAPGSMFRGSTGEQTMIAQPPPKADVIARRPEIVAGLQALLPASGVISEALRLKPYETDGLPAYRQVPLAVVLPETT